MKRFIVSSSSCNALSLPRLCCVLRSSEFRGAGLFRKQSGTEFCLTHQMLSQRQQRGNARPGSRGDPTRKRPGNELRLNLYLDTTFASGFRAGIAFI